MNGTKVIDEKYEIRNEIKRGGFGVIYQGVDLLFGKPVAIKAIDPALLDEAKYIDMFQAEALSIARLNHHNIVHIYDLKRSADGQFYIIMEYIDGFDLAQVLRYARKANQLVPKHLAVFIVAETCAGLDYAHNRRDNETNVPLNVVHQDISPSNIMITRNGEVKIIDFGMAKFFRSRHLKKNEVSIQGKINYIAPEQLNGSAEIDRRTDIFALGLVLFELLTGERFFSAETPEKNIEILRSRKWEFSRIESEEIPEKLRDVLRKAISPDVNQRYPTANHMYLDLMHYLIMAAPAADFTAELAEYVQKIDLHGARNGSDEKTTATDVIIDVDAEFDDSVDHSTAEAEQPKASGSGTKQNTSRPESRDIATADFMQISDKAVDEIESESKIKKPAARTAESAAEPEIAAAADEKQTAAATQEDHGKSTTSDLNQAELARLLAEEEEAHKTASEEKRPGTDLVQAPSQQSRRQGPGYYAVLEDEDDEEVKTIIDVVRLSARSHKKGILIGLASMLGLFLVYSVVDTSLQLTAYGTFLYDIISPPAIKISSIPSGAQVYLDDKPLQQSTPVRIEKIEPGVHKLMLVLPRFEPIVKSINVPREGRLQVVGEASRNPWENYLFRFKTQLEISSNPPGAEIYINGSRLVQTTPATVLWDVTEEPIRLTLSRPGFPDLTGLALNALEGKEQISDKRFWKFQRLDRLKDHFAIEGTFRKPVEIKSIPPKAEIFLNEEESPIGITDLNGTLVLPVGQHTVTLRKNGYLPAKFILTVDESTEPSYTQALSRRVRIFAKDASAMDESDLGATVVELRSGRRKIGINESTPADVTLLPYRYTAVLRKKDYEETFIQIPPDARTVIAPMNPVKAQATIFVIDALSSEPVNASEIIITGRNGVLEEESLGFTDETGTFVGELSVGHYQFRIQKPGYEDQIIALEVRSTQRNRVTAKLIRRR